MIVTKEFIREENGNCLDHICVYIDQLQFIAQAVYAGGESKKNPVCYQYDHGMLLAMSEIIRDSADQIEMICDAAADREMQQYHEIKFLKGQVNKMAGKDVADGLLTAFRKKEASQGNCYFSDPEVVS